MMKITRNDIPNLLTYFRIIAIPLLVFGFYLDQSYAYIVITGVFLLASISDFLDGYLARKWQVESRIGAALDPIADKMIVATALIMLAQSGGASAIAVLLILLREVWVSGLRECLAGESVTMPVTYLAKIKTTSQMIAIIFLLIATGEVAFWIYDIGNILLWVAAALTIITGVQYTQRTFAILK